MESKGILLCNSFLSLHAGSENENEQLKELHALMKEDLTPVEKVYVRKSIEQHKLGTNKTLLKQVRGNSFSLSVYSFNLYIRFRSLLFLLIGILFLLFPLNKTNDCDSSDSTEVCLSIQCMFYFISKRSSNL